MKSPQLALGIAVLVLGFTACSTEDEPEEFEGDVAGECEDGADNDRDGLFDCADDDCAGSTSCVGADGDGDIDADGDADEEGDGDFPACSGDEECDDGVFCNGVETCHPETGCQEAETPSCDDEISCTIDLCDLTADECLHAPIDEECDDGVDCTVDTCDLAIEGCLNSPVNEACDDGLWCTGAEICDAVEGCRRGTPPECTDDLDCTEDSCDEEADECVNVPVDGDEDGDLPPECGGGDCDDADPDANSDADEITCTGVNEDCDAATEDAPDVDDDGWDICGSADLVNPDDRQADCDDGNTEIHPEASEVCNGADDDCDGALDNGIACECDVGTALWCGGSPERHSCRQTCLEGSWGDCVSMLGHDVSERCGDGEDNDCDGTIDEPEPCTSACGEGEARCVGAERGDCVVPGVPCHVGDTQEEPCEGESRGICDPGTRIRRCRSDCEWNPWGACGGVVGPGEETCNGEDDNCNGTIDDGATGTDSYGRNDEIGRCASLGEDPDEMDIYPTIDSYGTDWFCFVGDDSSWNPLEDIDVRLTNLPGIDLDIILHFEDPETGTVTEMGRSERRGTMDEEIHFDDRTGTEDGGTWYIQVENNDEDAGGCYHLYVHGLR